MTEVQIKGDIAFTLAGQLLGHILDRIPEKARPASAFVAGGAAAPADDCCKGLLWVRVAQVVATDGGGNPLPDIRNWSIPTMGHSILLEVGILRCAPTLDDQGNAPTPAEETASALATAVDRNAVRMAILCDFPDDIAAIGADGQSVGAWEPVETGTCVGGYMLTTVGTSSTMYL